MKESQETEAKRKKKVSPPLLVVKAARIRNRGDPFILNFLNVTGQRLRREKSDRELYEGADHLFNLFFWQKCFLRQKKRDESSLPFLKEAVASTKQYLTLKPILGEAGGDPPTLYSISHPS